MNLHTAGHQFSVPADDVAANGNILMKWRTPLRSTGIILCRHHCRKAKLYLLLEDVEGKKREVHVQTRGTWFGTLYPFSGLRRLLFHRFAQKKFNKQRALHQ